MHKYNVSGTNGTCLLASMGLQLNVTYSKRDNTVGSALGTHLRASGRWCMCTPLINLRERVVRPVL